MNHLLSRMSAVLPLWLCAFAPVSSPTLIRFTPLQADIGDSGRREVRRVFTSRLQYEAYFRRSSPAEVDWSVDWVVYYAAGIRPTGGYQAKVLEIQFTDGGRNLKITTSLESPGLECQVTDSFSRPHTLAKFRRPAQQLDLALFLQKDVEIDCVP